MKTYCARVVMAILATLCALEAAEEGVRTTGVEATEELEPEGFINSVYHTSDEAVLLSKWIMGAAPPPDIGQFAGGVVTNQQQIKVRLTAIAETHSYKLQLTNDSAIGLRIADLDPTIRLSTVRTIESARKFERDPTAGWALAYVDAIITNYSKAIIVLTDASQRMTNSELKVLAVDNIPIMQEHLLLAHRMRQGFMKQD